MMSRAGMMKLAWLLAAVGVYALAALPMFASVRDGLVGVAGMLIGGAAIKRPGD